MQCKKCGHDEISIQYRAKGEEYAGNLEGSFVKIFNDGQRSMTQVVEEHLACRCNKCKYFWRQDTLDNIEIKKVANETKAKQELKKRGLLNDTLTRDS